MRRHVASLIIAAVICLPLISCSSGSAMRTAGIYDGSYRNSSHYTGGYYGSTQHHYVYHPPKYSYPHYTAPYSYPYTWAPARQVTGLTTTREVPNTYTDIQKIMDTCGKVLDPVEYDIEYARIPLEPRITNLDAENFSIASINVEYDPTDEMPNIFLRSNTYTVSIAVYHFSEVPAGNSITSISIDSLSRFYGPRSRGFYLGFRPNEDADYKWFGPFTTTSSWLLPMAPVLTADPTSPSLAVVVAQGDAFDLRSFTVGIEDYRDARARLQREREEYERELYQLQIEQEIRAWEELRLQQEWERLEYEYHWLRLQQREYHHKTYRPARPDGPGQPDKPDWPDKPGKSRLIQVTEDENPVVPRRHDLAQPAG